MNVKKDYNFNVRIRTLSLHRLSLSISNGAKTILFGKAGLLTSPVEVGGEVSGEVS